MTTIDTLDTVLEIFDGKDTRYVLVWLYSVNSWLRDNKPIDLLETDPYNVIHAARMAVAPIDHG